MAEKAPDVAFSVTPSLIHTMGFDETLVQRALEQADGNEELAIDFIVSGEVHDNAAAPTCAATLADNFGPSAIVFSLSSSESSIYTMGFDQRMVQRALEQADGNEELALDFILNGEIPRLLIDHFIGRPASFSFDADGERPLPFNQRAQIKLPLLLVKAAAFFFCTAIAMPQAPLA